MRAGASGGDAQAAASRASGGGWRASWRRRIRGRLVPAGIRRAAPVRNRAARRQPAPGFRGTMHATFTIGRKRGLAAPARPPPVSCPTMLRGHARLAFAVAALLALAAGATASDPPFPAAAQGLLDAPPSWLGAPGARVDVGPTGLIVASEGVRAVPLPAGGPTQLSPSSSPAWLAGEVNEWAAISFREGGQLRTGAIGSRAPDWAGRGEIKALQFVADGAGAVATGRLRDLKIKSEYALHPEVPGVQLTVILSNRSPGPISELTYAREWALSDGRVARAQWSLGSFAAPAVSGPVAVVRAGGRHAAGRGAGVGARPARDAVGAPRPSLRPAGGRHQRPLVGRLRRRRLARPVRGRGRQPLAQRRRRQLDAGRQPAAAHAPGHHPLRRVLRRLRRRRLARPGHRAAQGHLGRHLPAPAAQRGRHGRVRGRVRHARSTCSRAWRTARPPAGPTSTATAGSTSSSPPTRRGC